MTTSKFENEMPTINPYANQSNSYSTSELIYRPSVTTFGGDAIAGFPSSEAYNARLDVLGQKLKDFEKQQALEAKAKEKQMSNARIVQVYIVDTDKNVPIEKRLIYSGDQIFTDLSDQDLFFDIELKPLLAKHNEYRATLADKKKSTAFEKVFLEPVRVSDLKMTVAVLAQF